MSSSSPLTRRTHQHNQALILQLLEQDAPSLKPNLVPTGCNSSCFGPAAPTGDGQFRIGLDCWSPGSISYGSSRPDVVSKQTNMTALQSIGIPNGTQRRLNIFLSVSCESMYILFTKLNLDLSPKLKFL